MDNACAPALLLDAAQRIRGARHAVALTGAGVSTPSGIPDFRSPGSGLWTKANPFLVASIYGFRLRPRLFYDWIRPLARTLVEAQPNPAHLALAQLEQMGVLKAIITQNIDSLHQRAGSRRVIEVHGHARQATCVRCRAVVATDALLPGFIEGDEMPRCTRCGGLLKPNVILFGEQLPTEAADAARREANRCDLMVIAGSSLTVTPAAELPTVALLRGAQIVVIDQQPTPIDDQAQVVIRGDVATVLPRLVSLLTLPSALWPDGNAYASSRSRDQGGPL